MKKNLITHRLPKHLTISELSDYSNTSAATIRFYIGEALLPQPIRTSKTMAYYTEEHIKGLQNIQKLKQKGLSLTAIKEKIPLESHEISPKKAPINIVYDSKREEIVRAAVSLFRQKGYDATSIDEIIKQAGIGRGTYYHHFKNKESLFFGCADSVFYDIGLDNPQIQKEKDVIRRIWKWAYFFGSSDSHMIDMLNLLRGAAIQDSSILKEKLDDAVKNLVTPIQRELEIAISEKKLKLKDSMLTAYLLMGAMEAIIYYHRDHGINFKDLLAKAGDVAFQGIYSTDGLHKLPAQQEVPLKAAASMRNSRLNERDNVPAERRERIISSGVHLFLQKGYANTTIADIANETRMSKEVFYKYFKNKDELFIECADKIFYNMYNHVWQKIKKEPDRFKRIWKRLNAFFDSYPQWIVMMDLVRSLSVSENPVFKNKLYQLLRQMINPIIQEIEQLRQEGRLQKNLDSAVTGYVLMGIAEYGASLIHKKIYSRKKVIDYIDKIIRHGV